MPSDQVEVALKNVYKDNFNVYMMLNKLRKDLKRKDPFPDEVVLRFCEHYWKYHSQVKNTYPYFLKAFQMVSADWYANQHQAEHAKYKKQAPIAQSVKDVLKGMFG
jgi:hypothetical protein